MKKIYLVVGTRPEAIKMAPVYHALKKKPDLQIKLISTGQHRQLIQQAYESFRISPDIDLDVMQTNQSLSRLTANILVGLENVFKIDKPDIILAHGDTTTCYSTALSSFYHSIPFFHVEAGLRTYRLDSPFPEEFNRQCVAQLASHHFAPTETEKNNLLDEGISDSKITDTGGTIHDAVHEIQKAEKQIGSNLPPLIESKIQEPYKKLAVLTLHRRESGHNTLPKMMTAIKAAALRQADTIFIFPVHPNPLVYNTAREIFKDVANVTLTRPLEYRVFISLLLKADLVITDSGGVQEEAAYLGKRVLVLREKTERLDGVRLGLTKIVGTDSNKIESEIIHQLRPSMQNTTQENIINKTLKRASDIVADKVFERCYA